MYTNKKIISSLSYKFIEQLVVKGTVLVVGIVLARLLDVEDFGAVALLTVFTNLASVIIEGGLSTSLIQMKEIDTEDYSTVFYTCGFLAAILYFLLFLLAPSIARYYNSVSVCAYLRVIGLTLFSTPFNAIQLGYVYRHMLFKKLLIATSASSILSGAIGIGMAYMNFGPWSLIAQTVTSSIFSVTILFLMIPWKPTAEFSVLKLKKHFAFGWKLLMSSLIETGYNELRTLLIGKKYSESDLSYYNRGDTYPKTVMTSLNTAVQTVLFPVLASEQGDPVALKNIARKSVTLTSFVLFPVMAGFAAVAKNFVLLLLTEKWLPSVIYLQLACVTYAFMPVNSCNLQAIKAIGRSDIFLKLTLLKKAIGILLLILTVFWFKTPLAIAIIVACYAPLELFINAVPNKMLIGYKFGEQIKDMLVPLFLSVIMFSIVVSMNAFSFHPIVLMGLQVLIGVIVYVGLAIVFRVPAVKLILDKIREMK